MSEIRHMFGAYLLDKENNIPKFFSNETVNVPDAFDSRKEWASCHTIPEIRNQGQCGSW